ncbi:hypothetical protein AB0M20_02870 [Actinoplanes sp. NPDC051633]|uniref:hypothetical protein n=1 Tax=Actinoplanes sp. NPDC051633 TaxID=3155670 RepID=UPI00344AA0BF
MPFRLLTVVIACAAGLAGCSADEPAAPPPASARSAPVPADPPATEDVPGTLTCGALASAINDATLMNPGVVDAIVAASASADAPIADAARRLSDAYKSAVSSAGTDDEPDAVAAVSAAGAEMSTVCGESGLDTVG